MMSKVITLLLALAGAMSTVSIAGAQTAASTPAAAGIAASPANAMAPGNGGSAAAGHAKAAMCSGCHGIVGYQASFPEVYKVPMIAGQGAKYIVSALTEYKKGERKHPSMRAVATSLTDADMADLAAYYEQLGAAPALKTVADAPAAQPLPEVGALLAKGACASCHGASFSKPIDPAYPKLAGQHADYLFAALRAYGTEGNPHMGRANAIMSGQVKQFKRDELKAIASYLSTLPGEVHTVSQSKFK